MEQSNILAYHHHDKWLETILACRLETVPAGYSRTTFQQIEAADKKGLHLCAIRGCYKQHPALDCPAKKKD